MQYSFSYWEKSVWFNDVDVVIIGSGIVGLSAAIRLKESQPHFKILILERGLLPSGASSKNAGFAAFGSPSELLMDLKTHSEDEVFGLVTKRLEGLRLLRKNLGDSNIGYEDGPGHELFLDKDEDAFDNCMAQLDYLNRSIEEWTGIKNVYVSSDESIQKFGFQGVKHIISNTGEGTIDTGKMIDTLIRKAVSLEIRILNNVNVESYLDEGKEVIIKTNLVEEIITRNLLIATNAFTKDLIPDINVIPGRGQVIVTSELDCIDFHGPCHFDEGYFYFRKIGKRVLIGGGRNLNFETERTTKFGLTELVQNKLEQYLRDMILPGKKFKIEQRWSGIMAFGDKKTVLTQQLSSNVFCAVRLGGIGIAIGSLIGKEAADLLMNKN